MLSDYGDAVALITPDADRVKYEIKSELINKGFDKASIVEQLPINLWTIRGQYFDDVLALGGIFADVGCLNCVTSLDFMRRCPFYKGIIAFEPDPVSYSKCVDILKIKEIPYTRIYNIGLWNKKDELSFIIAEGGNSRISDEGTIKVQLNTLDDILKGEKVSLIKMDIEGAELKALEGCEKTIKKHKPRLAICVYHKLEDIIEIPAYIHKIEPNYKLYMRHYSNKSKETVLYAVVN